MPEKGLEPNETAIPDRLQLVATPYLALGRALCLVRLLDRDAAHAALLDASAMEQKPEFWSLHAWMTSLNDLTWQDAGTSLARLEATVSGNPPFVGHATLSDTFEVRARNELLCGARRINQDNALLKPTHVPRTATTTWHRRPGCTCAARTEPQRFDSPQGQQAART